MTETEYLVESATVPMFSRKLRWPAYTNKAYLSAYETPPHGGITRLTL